MTEVTSSYIPFIESAMASPPLGSLHPIRPRNETSRNPVTPDASIRKASPAFSLPTPAEIAAIVQSITGADSETALQVLWKLLHRLNRMSIPVAADRLALMEILLPTVTRALAFQATQSGHGFPMEESRYLSALCGVRMATAFGQAYWLIINSPDFAHDDRCGDAHGARILRTALELHGLVMLKAFENYTPLPASFWRQVYGIFARAELRGWVNLDCGPVLESGMHSTISDAFSHLCLFAVVNPHQYRPDEVRGIYRFLAQHSRYAELICPASLGGKSAQFTIDLFAETPPTACEFSESEEHTHSGMRFLRTMPLVAQALETLGSPSVVPDMHGLAGAKAKKVVRTLAVPLARRSQRFAAEGKLGLVLGLGYLQDSLNADDEQNFVEHRGIKWLRVPALALEDVECIELVERFGFADEQAKEGGAVAPLQFDSKSSSNRIWSEEGIPESYGFTATLQNSSARGFGLSMSGKRQGCLNVGALLGLRSTTGRFHVAVIRWLRHDERGGLSFGVELLMPTSAPVRMIVQGDRGRVPNPGLFYPGNSTLTINATLVAAPGVLRLNQLVMMESLSGQPVYRMTKLVESTPHFQQFSVLLVDD